MVAELRQPVEVLISGSPNPALFFLSRCPMVGERVTFGGKQYTVTDVVWDLDHEVPTVIVEQRGQS